MDDTTTWDEAMAILAPDADASWHQQVHAFAVHFGCGDDFIDWLANGSVSGTDTVGEIFADWDEWQETT